MSSMFHQAVAEHKLAMEEATRLYQQTIDEAMARIETLTKEPEPAPTHPPQAVWTKADDGEDMLVLNEPAAKALLTLIEQVGDMVKEMSKKQ